MKEKIFKRMVELGINQEELAKNSGLSPVTISGILNDKIKNLKPETVKKLMIGLKCSYEYLKPSEKNEGEPVNKEQKKEEYILPDQTSEGFRDFLNDEDTMLLITPTEEELEWLKKNVVFMPEDKPTKQTYIDLLLTYRKLKKGNK